MVDMYPSIINKHCQGTIRCHGQYPVEHTFTGLEFQDSLERQPGQRRAPGPKPLDINTLIRGRIAAFEDDAFDERIEYLFNTEGLLNECFKANAGDCVPSYATLLFIYLWGSKAPPRFQSIFTYRGLVYEVGTDADEAIIVRNDTITKYFNDSFYEDFLECLAHICRVSIPQRRPDLNGKAQHILDWTEREDNLLTIRDVYEKNDKYNKHRKTAHLVVIHANKLRFVLKNAITASKTAPKN